MCFEFGYSLFCGYSQVLTFIGNIDLASLDQNQEADKWLFDVVQPWMEK
jgi:pyrimidine-specific ribonucleoside hydrolase